MKSLLEDEALRLRGVRLTLSDILSKRLQWKPFNGTWHSGMYTFYHTSMLCRFAIE